ncbi:cytochrome P450 [Psychromarinibacter sp. C21-152]|uniref:Cytochrome P450 n=1 Tax=Psychromarinibacter sediminicola TaxID=3033385 RepID=A0AAE3NVM2_9RHOB|nr:cytochrome P450 [Psychromarinibacter sediminicola]MDF0602936.1 cytochrome P450 [Psychromarinibacter sediminicola]
MSTAPVYNIDPAAFLADPYPDLAKMRADGPVWQVPQLGATLFVRRDDIFEQEKRIDVFSSYQPEGLMTVLMGENMMRKDGPDHAAERKATFPAFSPRTVRDSWTAQFRARTQEVLDRLAPKGGCDLVADYAMPVSAEALKAITGLANMDWREMDRVSQGMIDGIANYGGDPSVEAHCHDCTASIDAHIDARLEELRDHPDTSLLSVQVEAGLPMDSVRANVKLAISGGQNEPRDAIAGAAWALLTHPEQLAMIRDGSATWRDAFEEYARWISPIGMSPRRVARADTVQKVAFEPEERVFFMFGSGNRDERVFDAPEVFDITRDTGPSLAFGAGPHFCAGAAASRAMISEVALPMLFDRFPDLAIDGEVPFAGWAFRGPLKMPVRWS